MEVCGASIEHYEKKFADYLQTNNSEIGGIIASHVFNLFNTDGCLCRSSDFKCYFQKKIVLFDM